MARRWLKIGVGAGAGVVTVAALFQLLLILYGFQIIDVTGDIECIGTYENPCISEFSVRNPNPYNVDIYNKNETRLDFSPDITDYALFTRDGRCSATGSCRCEFDNGQKIGFDGWRCTDFTNATKPLSNREYVFRFPLYSTKEFLLAGVKNSPFDEVKWGFGIGKDYLDPVWEDVAVTSVNPVYCKGTALPPAPFKESYDPYNVQTYCLNGSVLFIAQNISYAWVLNNSNPYKLVGSVIYADMYVNSINYSSPLKLSNSIVPITIHFNYSIPSWDIPEKLIPYFGGNETYCPIGDLRYGVYISNDNKDSFYEASFKTGGKDLFRKGKCDVWYRETTSIPDLKNNSLLFSLESKSIGALGLETPNIYIDLNSVRFCRNEICQNIL